MGVISTSDFSLLSSVGKVIPALIAGNTVVHKPSEVNPLSVLRFAKSFAEAGFPPGTYNIVVGLGVTAGHALSTSMKVDKLFFTGSSMVGKIITEDALKSNMKKLNLQMSGKGCIIIHKEVNLDLAANLIWACLLYNSGQCCVSPQKLYIHEQIYAPLLEKIKTLYKIVYAKDPFEGGNHGPLINKFQFEKVYQQVEYAKKVEKLKVLCGGQKYGGRGYFLQPTIFTDVPEISKLASEEVFGPIMCIMREWN